MAKMIRIGAIALTLVCGITGIGNAETFSGVLVGIVDGDTVCVEWSGGMSTIHLAGVDAPETDQPYGTEAAKYARELGFKKKVTVHALAENTVRGLVGTVVLADGSVLNRRLVEAGFGWCTEGYASVPKECQSTQRQAKQQQKGLWSASDPIPPWDWRNGIRRVVEGEKPTDE